MIISDLIIYKENLPAFKEAMTKLGIALIGSIERPKHFDVKIKYENAGQFKRLKKEFENMEVKLIEG